MQETSIIIILIDFHTFTTTVDTRFLCNLCFIGYNIKYCCFRLVNVLHQRYISQCCTDVNMYNLKDYWYSTFSTCKSLTLIIEYLQILSVHTNSKYWDNKFPCSFIRYKAIGIHKFLSLKKHLRVKMKFPKYKTGLEKELFWTM